MRGVRVARRGADRRAEKGDMMLGEGGDVLQVGDAEEGR